MEKLPIKLSQDLEKIKDSRYVNQYSEKIFDDIFITWLIKDVNISDPISKISSKYMVSTFILYFLKNINDTLQEKYDIESFSAKDWSDFEKVEIIVEKISNIQNDQLVLWLTNECMPELEKILDQIHIKNFEDLTELGITQDILTTALDQGKENSVEGYLYDILYQFKDRLKENNLLKKKSIPGVVFRLSSVEGTLDDGVVVEAEWQKYDEDTFDEDKPIIKSSNINKGIVKLKYYRWFYGLID